MEYCTGCGAPFQATLGRCERCGGQERADAGAMKKRGRLVSGALDTRRFVRVDTSEDPFTTEQLVGALLAAHLTVFSRPQRAGMVDAATTGVTTPWWEILVPEGEAEAATALLRREHARLEATAQEAARAAEEEEAETEAGLPPGGP